MVKVAEARLRQRDRVKPVVWPVVAHSARTAVAAVASVLVARLFRLPEAYWALITTLVVAQSSLGAALIVSWQFLVGTALGAVVAAMVASLLGPSLFVFGASIFVLGPACAIARSDRSAFRFAGVTLAIVLLIPGRNPVWQIAVHRFAEVCIGIAVALILTVVWPEREAPVQCQEGR
jgi:uncharacterized membrane protein YgaE (UPF0421/DUF939 family)